MASLDSTIPASTYWYVDSGCTEHMCPDITVFSTYQDISREQRLVEGIGGIKLQVAGIGDIIIKIWINGSHTFGILKGVVHVPGLGRNLFSSYIAAQRKMYTLHMENGCQIVENDKAVMTGVIHCRMYRLLFESVPPPTPSMALIAAVQPTVSNQVFTASSFRPTSKT